tara:strand:+ start:5793 stop:6179 length:387 start_codon:yes stop_codon:yes gene_type:complete
MLKETAKTLLWFIDEERLGIVQKNESEDSTGKVLTEFKSPTISIGMGIRIRYKANHRPVDSIDQDLDAHSNLHESLHPALVCYVKSRLYEDAGDLKTAQYFRQMYEVKIRKFPDSRDPGGIVRQYFKF